MQAPPINTAKLTEYFLETLISYGIPTVLSLVVIAFAAKSFKSMQKEKEMNPNGGFFGKNAVSELYDDLYGSENTKPSSLSFLSKFSPTSSSSKEGRKNIGIPFQQFLSITKINDVYSSYAYSITAATESKARAASNYRSYAFDSALSKAFNSAASSTSFGEGGVGLSNAKKMDLLMEEKEFLKRGNEVYRVIVGLQRKITDLGIVEQMKEMDVDVGEVDAHVPTAGVAAIGNVTGVVDAEIVNATLTSTNSTTTTTTETKKKKTEKKEMKTLLKELEKQNTELIQLELDFIRAIVDIMGADSANAIRAAILGNIDGGGSSAGLAGSLLSSLNDRPLSSVLFLTNTDSSSSSSGTSPSTPPSLFVTDFPGDVSASQVDALREEVTAIVRTAKPGDEALVVLQSGGGTVTGYGLAAAQLQRFKQHGMKLTICVEQVAASGGYMMCCVADKVIASPFAVLGSIGVISDLPNVYERLKKEGIEFQTVTAGKYKRTLTPTKKVTREDLEKSKEDIEKILVLFKSFVKQNRPSLDIDDVATGETWFGEDALAKGLCDEIRTADDVLSEYVDKEFNVYEVKYDPIGLGANGLGALPFGRRGVGASATSAMSGNGNVSNNGGIVQSAARWLVRNVVPALQDEFMKELERDGGVGGTRFESSSVRERYMAKDPSDIANRIRMED